MKEHRVTKATEYAKLVQAERTAHKIEVRERSTGKSGVANTYGSGVADFFGADDGSEDKVVTPEAFSDEFEITAIVIG